MAVELLAPADATSVDLASRTLTLGTQHQTSHLEFDGLVVASGAGARRLPLGVGNRNVHKLRSSADAATLRAALHDCQQLCVIGGGFIGLEVAALAASLGQSVVVVESAPLPMLTVLGAEPAAIHMRMLEGRGVQFRLHATVTAIDDHGGRSTIVRLASGEDIIADAVLIAVGAAPETDWLAGNGLNLSDGVLCDEHCAVVGADGVVACGDVARWFNPLLARQMRIEHWSNAIEQGRYAARQLLGLNSSTGYASLPYFWSDQADLKLQMVGSSEGHDETVITQETADRLKVEYRSQGRLLGLLGINEGPAVMSRKAEIVRAYQESSSNNTAVAQYARQIEGSDYERSTVA